VKNLTTTLSIPVVSAADLSSQAGEVFSALDQVLIVFGGLSLGFWAFRGIRSLVRS
jgi:hypothetical protein